MEIRRARPDDAPELVRLRQVMFDAMGVRAGGAGWKAAREQRLRAGLVDGTFTAFVVEAPPPDGGLAACGVATVAQRLPGPANRSGLSGYLQSMVTDHRFRRQGLARAIFVALMGWLDDEGVDAVDLHATPEGEPLYRSSGSTGRPAPPMPTPSSCAGHGRAPELSRAVQPRSSLSIRATPSTRSSSLSANARRA